MNRFEALHALGLEEGADDDDVKLSYYGLEKTFDIFDFSDVEALQRRVDSFLNRAKEAKKYLLNPRNKSAARQVQSYASPGASAKLCVTPLQEKTARLKGLERLRVVVCGYMGGQQERVRNSIIVLLVCIAVGFVALRYVRLMMARLALFTVLALVAVAGSTVLTQAILTCRKVKVHIYTIDEVMKSLKVELGLAPEDVEGCEECDDRALPASDEADVDQDEENAR